MAVDTGIEKDELQKVMLPRLRPKVEYCDGWVYLINFKKHHVNESPNAEKGYYSALSEVPSHILNKFGLINKPLEAPSSPLEGLGYSSSASALTFKKRTPLAPKSSQDGLITKKMKKNKLGSYREDRDSEAYEEVVDLETGEKKIEAPKTDLSEKYWEMIHWAENRRGSKFLKESIKKQFKAFKIARENNISSSMLQARWVDFEKIKWRQENGWDFMDIVLNFNKKHDRNI